MSKSIPIRIRTVDVIEMSDGSIWIPISDDFRSRGDAPYGRWVREDSSGDSDRESTGSGSQYPRAH